MRNRLLTTLALAVLGAAVTAGAVSAGPLDVGGAGVDVDLPGGGNLPDVGGVLPACSNGQDDDGDGLIDLADPGCSGPLDNDESNPATPPPDSGGTDGGGTGGGSGGGGTGGGGSTGGSGGGGGGGAAGGGGGVGSGTVGGSSGGKGGGQGGGGKGSGGAGPKGPGDREAITEPTIRKPDGTPTRANPALSVAQFGPAPIGVPNFMIDQFTIPPFLLPLYQACGTEYGIPWEVLASINRIETAFGTNLNVSSAGAVGWMQFIPSSWKAYGVDANLDGVKDPYNPYDAICAAARYLKAAGGETDLPRAIFAYNHADWYVDEVLLYARQYGRLPDHLVGSLTGLTEGAHFPVAARARYADDISERKALKRSKPGQGGSGNVADVIRSSPTRRGINIYARKNAPVVAVNDGVVKKIGKNDRLGRYLVLQDGYGNRFTYAQLGRVADVHPVPKERDLSAADFKLVSPRDDAKPSKPATAGSKRDLKANAKASSNGTTNGKAKGSPQPTDTEDARQRLYALPERPRNLGRADLTGQLDQLLGDQVPGYETFKAYFSDVLEFDPKTMDTRPLREGSRVVAGTVLGRVGPPDELASHVHFGIRPSGRGAKKIDPKPILDGWKLLESTAIYRAAGESPFERRFGVGQILLMSKPQLQRRVLSDPRLEIYACGREDIRSGQIDKRVLASLGYLTERGFRLTVTSLKCGHSFYTSSGGVSHHSSGNAVDIASINGQPIIGNQGRGSLTEAVIRDLLQLQGSMEPAQIISLMELGGPTFAMGDHADHIHVGFQPISGPGTKPGQQFVRVLKPDQWQRLVERIAKIDQPEVPTKTSRFALPSKRAGSGKGNPSNRASDAHLGE